MFGEQTFAPLRTGLTEGIFTDVSERSSHSPSVTTTPIATKCDTQARSAFFFRAVARGRKEQGGGRGGGEEEEKTLPPLIFFFFSGVSSNFGKETNYQPPRAVEILNSGIARIPGNQILPALKMLGTRQI